MIEEGLKLVMLQESISIPKAMLNIMVGRRPNRNRMAQKEFKDFG